MMPVTDFFKRHFGAVSRIIMSLTASAMALAGTLSVRALSQVQPMYGVPYEPVIKYGVPPFTPTPLPVPKYGPMPGPTEIIQSILPSRGVIVAIAAVAVIVVFAGLGLLYYISHRKK